MNAPKCEAIDMKITFNPLENKTKVICSLVLKVRVFATQK